MEEDAALREVVKKALEGKGVLAQIRASLRAAVFTVVDEHERASGVHVPNPSALDVKHDVRGRLALQLVADFLEHWQLHQTLSILKLETDLAAGDLLPREQLESIVGSDYVAAAAAGNGETKSSGDKSAPVLHQLLAGGPAVSPGDGNGLPLGASGGIGGSRFRVTEGGGGGGNPGGGGGEGARLSTLSLSFGGGGNLAQRSEDEHKKEPEEKGGTGDDEGGGQEGEIGLDAEGDLDLPSRVTLRKRRAGGARSVGSSSSVDGDATLSSSDAPAAAAEAAEAGEVKGDFAAASSSPQPSLPPERSSSQLLRERDADVDADADAEPPWRRSAASPAAGEEGHHGANHFDGSMDESSYHFSEYALSVEGAAESPMMGAAAAAGTAAGSGRGAWRPGDEFSAVAAAAAVAEGVSDPQRAAAAEEEEEEEEGGSPEYDGRGGVGGDGAGQDGSSSSSRFAMHGGGRGLANAVILDDDGGGGSTGGGDGQNSLSNSGDAAGAVGDFAVFVDREDGGHGDGDEEEGYDDDFDDDFDDDDGGGDAVAEEALPATRDGVGGAEEHVFFGAQGSGGPDEDAEQAAGLMKAEDEEWEARIGLSAESSVAVGSGGDDDALDSEAYDEIEDAQSI